MHLGVHNTQLPSILYEFEFGRQIVVKVTISNSQISFQWKTSCSMRIDTVS